jgi:archaellum biogenesis protein FlaJ (TadC family)
MTSEEEKEIKEGLQASRDTLQATLSEARHMRAEIGISNRDKSREFLQRVGELSLTLGAAIIPLVLITHAGKDISHITFALAGVALYLVNGLVVLWKTKTLLEQDADDTPHIGLDEEIFTYPVINALNKLLYDLRDKNFQQEYKQAQQAAPRTVPSQTGNEETRASFIIDILLTNFVIASLLITRTVWPYSSSAYWLIFVVILLFIALLVWASYKRTAENQAKLRDKHKKLAEIKGAYQEWEQKIMGGK